jgi:hypothetical protein
VVSENNNLNLLFYFAEPSIGTSYQISINLAKLF